MPIVSKKPWMVPSSPFGPCKIGKTIASSSLMRLGEIFSPVNSPSSVASFGQVNSNTSFEAGCSVKSGPLIHSPSLVIKTNCT